jgi:hypothetical protein
MNGNGPAFKATGVAGAALASQTPTKILFATEVFDTNNCYDPATSRFTPNVPGYYMVVAGVGGTGGAATDGLQVTIRKNNVTDTSGAVGIGNGFFATRAAVSGLVFVNGTTDYLEIFATASGAINTSGAETSIFFSAALVRAG